MTAPNGLQPGTFLITDPTDPDVTAKATLNDSSKLPSNTSKTGGCVAVGGIEKLSSHVVVQVSPYIDFLVPSTCHFLILIKVILL